MFGITIIKIIILIISSSERNSLEVLVGSEKNPIVCFFFFFLLELVVIASFSRLHEDHPINVSIPEWKISLSQPHQQITNSPRELS